MKVPWNRGGLRTYLTVLAIVFARPGHEHLLWGTPLLLAGLALHIYAKGCLKQNETVAMDGPYRFVRHPFYSANLLIDESIALMSGWWPLIIFLPIWWLLVYWPVMKGEEEHLSKLFPDMYPEYQRRTWRLIPLGRPLPPSGDGFSLKNRNITHDTVIPRAIRILAYPLLFVIWRELWAKGLQLGDGRELTAAAGLVAAYVLAWQIERHLKHGRLVLPGSLPDPATRLVCIVVVLAIAGVVHRSELESDIALVLGGLALAASLAVYLRRPEAWLAAEGLCLAAFTVMCELPWLAAAPILFYSAMVLDQRTLRLSGEQAAAAPLPARVVGLPALYYCMLVVGSIITVVKEVV